MHNNSTTRNYKGHAMLFSKAFTTAYTILYKHPPEKKAKNHVMLIKNSHENLKTTRSKRKKKKEIFQ